MSTPRPPAIVLLSGGLDSATVLAIASHRDGFEPHCLSFRYGQRHAVELDCAYRIAAAMRVGWHRTLEIDLRAFGQSALTSDTIAVPRGSTPPGGGEIPVTYVPARNTIFLSFALAAAETLGASDIYLGVNALDYSGYPDCRPEYILSYEQMANLATRAAVQERTPLRIRAPLINLTKAQIIRIGVELGVDYAMTSSCYDPSPDGRACGECDACHLRRKGFREAGVADPTVYA